MQNNSDQPVKPAPPARPATLRLSLPAAVERAASFQRGGLLADAEKIYCDILEIQPDHFDSLQLLAVLRYQQGRDAEALPLFERACTIKLDSAELWSNFGLLLARLGRLDEAFAAYDKAIRLKSGYPEALANLGHLLLAQHRDNEALENFNRALLARRGFVDALIGRGLALYKLKRFTDALVAFDHVPGTDPRCYEALTHCAGPLMALGRHAEALAVCERAIAYNSRHAVAHYNRGVVLTRLDRRAEAVSSFDAAIALNPRYVDALLNRGNLLEQLGRLSEALASAECLIALNPGHGSAWNNRGNVLLRLGRHDEAIASYEKAISLDPAYGECFYNYGNALVEVGRVADALFYYEKALALRPDHPDIPFNEGLARLLLGDLKRGLQRYEGRFEKTEQAPLRRKFKAPYWEGGDLAGKTILLHAEQGHGDTIQFVRYAPLLAHMGATVLLEVQESLKPLLAGVEGVAQVFGRDERGRSEPLPDVDCQQYLISLAHIFGTELHSIPAAVPYIRAPAERLQVWRERLLPRQGLRVGLTWSGNPEVKTDTRRSIGLPALTPLASVPGVQLVSLHREVRAEHAQALRAFPHMVHLGGELRDFADTAAIISELDLVISSDTAVAHLAGAMGKPLWLLLMFAADWRWLLDRDDSPWYPTAKLYRQPRIGDWASVVKRVRADLAQRAAAS
ncbi:MAG TPA: tetratricopeptide repeat protein [Xanthobacteraceae bacterium]|nr:tetratricopeptide repeat protein [Xanthobacteraceae bacterium]